jgi:DivIVA domain-containing protein
MMDETFHLTPLDVRRYEFGKALRGYDPERVNQFRDQVAEELERLSRINQDLEAKARGFHEQLRAFRERDKAINEALVSAQQLRKDIREQADKESQLIIREARAEADRIVEDARQEIRRMEDQIASLDRARRAYLAQLRMVVERQLAEISAAEHASNPSIQPAVKEAIRHSAGSSTEAAESEPAAVAPERPSDAAPSWYESLIKE